MTFPNGYGWRRAAASAVVLFVVCARPAWAQDAFRQTVVVTAAATPVSLESVTRTVTIITRDQIASLPVYSIADVLRLTASVDVRARGERGVQTDFAVRGANFGQMLVLVDGVRLNDAQSGHHNGDIPVSLDAVERIEILHGAGSSLFGADAFGGTINVITRRDAAPASATVETGSFGLIGGRAQAGFSRGRVTQTFDGLVERSGGFMFERGHETASLSARTTIGERTGVSASWLRKEFGANGFYGAAPSHEWTNQAMVAADHRFAAAGPWQVRGAASYRTHGDTFFFNVLTPGLFENRHRTHAVLATLAATRPLRGGASITAGVEGGGDWIRSSNLGDHTTGRVSAFGEWRQDWNDRLQLDGSLRVDRYDEFGTSWSPSVGAGWWPTRSVRLRASASRAFRVPTFTERYYQDGNHLARAEVGAETAWAGETGADLFLANGWSVTATVFGRAEQDVIDWLRPTTAERWRTFNIRDVDTMGVELGVRRSVAGGWFQVQYTGLDVQAGAVTQLSKYVLDYAPHSLTGAAVLPLPKGVSLAPRVEFRHRSRSTGSFDYTLLDLRVARRFGQLNVYVDGANLLNSSYQEVLGVDMPGRSAVVGLSVAAR